MSQAPLTRETPRLLTLASVIVAIAALYFAKDVLVPVALAVMFSFLLAPLVVRLQRTGLGRIPAVIAVTLITFGIVGFLIYILYTQVHDLMERLPSYQQTLEEKAQAARSFFAPGQIDKSVKIIEKSIEHATSAPSTQPAGVLPTSQLFSQPVPVSITNFPREDTGVIKRIYTALSPFIDPLATAGIVIVFTIFMLMTREDLRDRIIRLIGQARINLTTQAMDDAAGRISKFLIAQAIVNGTYGLTISIGLLLIGQFLGHVTFPNFLLWGLLCAVMRFIPYIGAWVGALFPIAISMLVYHGMAVPLAVIALFLVIELLSNNLMEPWLYGSSTGVSTLAILIAAVFWTWLWGFTGLLLSTPLTVIIVVLGKYVPQLEFLNILLGDAPALAPKYRLYQRLLADDPEEAQAMLAEHVTKNSLAQAYDDVVLPALGLAEVDRHHNRLDDARQHVMRQTVRELVDELGERPRAATKTSEGTSPKRPYDRCILCLPARDEADELAAIMLAQLMEGEGYCAEYVSVTRLASEMIDMVEQKGARVVVVSALPPAAVTHARYLVKRLKTRFPDLKIVVGLWTAEGDLTSASTRLSNAGATATVSTLSTAIEQLRQITTPLAMEERAAAPALAPAAT